MPKLVIDKADISIKPIDAELCSCGSPISHAVWMEWRAAGVQTVVLTACYDCADTYAYNIRSSIISKQK